MKQSSIEQLTDDACATDHAALVAQLEAAEQHSRDTAGAYAEKSEALILAEAQLAELTRERDEARVSLKMNRSLADSRGESLTKLVDTAERTTMALQEAQTEVTRLTEALAAAERRSVFNAGKCGEEYARAEAAESSLAAANALLERCKEQDLPWGLLEDMRAHLTAQPATAPARGDVLSDGTWIRTPEEERAATAPARDEASDQDFFPGMPFGGWRP